MSREVVDLAGRVFHAVNNIISSEVYTMYYECCVQAFNSHPSVLYM